MRRGQPRSRSGLRSDRSYQAGFGARHPIVYNNEVGRFFSELDRRWADILPEREDVDRQLTGLPEDRFRLYDDPEKIGVSVLERRLSAAHARRHRLQWTPDDVGRMRGRIEDEIARLNIQPDDLQLTFTAAVRVGDAGRRTRGGKFAIVPEANHQTTGLLVAEHEIIVTGMGGVFRNFRYPYDEYVPKMTTGRVFRTEEPAKVDACAGELQDLLKEQPLAVTLGEIVFFAHQEL